MCYTKNYLYICTHTHTHTHTLSLPGMSYEGNKWSSTAGVEETTLNYFFFFLGGRATWLARILVPQAGIEPGATTVTAPSPNHWTSREAPA